MLSKALSVLVAAGAISVAVCAGLAGAGGGPVLPGFSTQGVATANGQLRYLARSVGPDTRVIVRARDGRTRAATSLRGRFAVPMVAYDGSAGGLSADGHTLLLVRPRVAFPQRLTTLAILDARVLRTRLLVHLRGDFSFDAISPNGVWVYLIQYTSRTDTNRYRVRALDARTGRLSPRPIVDPRDREKMGGFPIARATSRDGRWAYTLYLGTEPFVHALNTAERTARCLDLRPFSRSEDPYAARLRLAGDSLLITLNHRALDVVNTRTLAVRRMSRIRQSQRASGGGSIDPAPPIAIAILLVALTLIALTRRRAHRSAPNAP